MRIRERAKVSNARLFEINTQLDMGSPVVDECVIREVIVLLGEAFDMIECLDYIKKDSCPASQEKDKEGD